MEKQPLWQPSRDFVAGSNLTTYRNWLLRRGKSFSTYAELWEWSTSDLEGFWRSILEYFHIQYSGEIQQVLSGAMPDCSWFAGIKLSYAEHVFRNASVHCPALICANETPHREEISWASLRNQTANLQRWLLDQGVVQGDCVAGVLSNQTEATVSFLAANACGAIWSCCSPDFGTASIIDRFVQIQPKILIASPEYQYNGKRFDRLRVIKELTQQLPSVKHVIIIGDTKETGFTAWNEIVNAPSPPELTFERVPFSDPIWVLYSSGTTGLPKAITHSTGGILLEQLKYGTFHNDIKPGERFFWYTTTGWMMWNYLQGTLLCGATAVLYDGSPAYPNLNALWKLTAALKLHHLGVSAGFIVANRKEEIDCADLDLSHLRSVNSTGSTLPPEGFDWVYNSVKKDVWLVSMSGGTDVCSAFIGGNPWAPVHRGEIQCRALGCRLEAWDELAKPVLETLGEMVITQPMPSMPIFFWNDPHKKRYRESYFETYPGVWRHGDWIEITATGGIIVSGRSDATLNRGGVRIGTSEVYRAVESVPEIEDSLIVCIEKDQGEFYMPLFVVMRPGRSLTPELVQAINSRLRTQCSPRHVPDEIITVPQIPYTISGKKTELPVKKILSGKANATSLQAGSLRNPESLRYFQQVYEKTKAK